VDGTETRDRPQTRRDAAPATSRAEKTETGTLPAPFDSAGMDVSSNVSTAVEDPVRPPESLGLGTAFIEGA
jgi:hypothetical protein